MIEHVRSVKRWCVLRRRSAMKCTHCSHEQTGGAFCSKCGQPLNGQHTSPNEKPDMGDSTSNKENSKAAPVKEKQHMNLSFKLNQETIKVALYTMTPVLLLSAVLAWIFTWVMKSSVFIKDYTYLLFSNTLGVSDNILVELVTQIKVTFWDILVVAHSASYEGVFQSTEIDKMQFSSHVPVIIAPIILGVLIAVVHRFIKGRLDVSFKVWLQGLLLGSVVYGLIVTIVAKILEPTYQTNEAVYELSTPLFVLFFKATILFFVAGCFGLKVWTFKKAKPSGITKALVALRPFVVTLMFGLLGLAIVIVGMWALIHPADIFTKPLTTPSALWLIYNHDPLFYMLLPTFLFGELLYAIGNSFVISSNQISELIQLPSALKMNALTGVKTLGEHTYDKQVLQMIQTSTRFIWYTFVFLLVFLFSLNRVHAQHMKSRLTQIVAIGLLFGVIAGGVSFTFSSEMGTSGGTIGFSVILTVIVTMVISGLYFLVKYFLTDMLRKKVGEKTG